MSIDLKYGVPTVCLHTSMFHRLTKSVVRVNGAPVPFITSNLWSVPDAAWRYDAGGASTPATTQILLLSGMIVSWSGNLLALGRLAARVERGDV